MESHIAASLKRALQGAVTPNLQAAGFRLEDQLIITVFVFAVAPSDGEFETTQIIGTHVISDFPDLDIREEMHTVGTGPLPHAALGWLVFERS